MSRTIPRRASRQICHELSPEARRGKHITKRSPGASQVAHLLRFGGFAYFSDDAEVLQINAMEPVGDSSEGANQLLFEPRRPLPREAVRDLAAANRFVRVTKPEKRSAGARY